MKKYKTCRFYRSQIREVEITKETDKSVFFIREGYTKQERAKKESYYDIYWNTWEEAYNYLLKQAESKFEIANRELEEVKKLKRMI